MARADPRPVPAARAAVREDELRGGARRARGERAVRPREGRVLRRGRAAARPLRAGRRRHAVPRRDRRHAGADAGQAAARPAGRRDHARGRRRRDQGGRARASPRPTATSTRCWRTAASARTSTTGSTPLSVRTPALRERPQDIPALAAHFAAAAARAQPLEAAARCRRTRSRCSQAAALEGQRPRAAQRGGARAHPVRRRSRSAPPTCGPRCPGAAGAPRRARARSPARRPAARRSSTPTSARSSASGCAPTGGHVTNAARSLGLERSHLYKKCRQLGIDIREDG